MLPCAPECESHVGLFGACRRRKVRSCEKSRYDTLGKGTAGDGSVAVVVDSGQGYIVEFEEFRVFFREAR